MNYKFTGRQIRRIFISIGYVAVLSADAKIAIPAFVHVKPNTGSSSVNGKQSYYRANTTAPQHARA